MDQFYGDVYRSLIYKWLLDNQRYYDQNDIHVEIDKQYQQKLIFSYHDLTGIIEFWAEQNIIEETILNSHEELLFYLHYTINNLSGCKHFIKTFFHELLAYPKSRHIGVSCSSGMTTAIYIQKLQELSRLLNLPYSFQSIPYSELKNVYKDYDMILLAPQMAYLQPKTIEICKDHCHVETIDAYAFATFNYQKTLNMIENYFMS